MNILISRNNFSYFSMKICKYFYETDGLIVRIVDTKKNMDKSIETCEKFGEVLAPINNQKRLDDTLDQLKNCYKKDVHGINDGIEDRLDNKYQIGLHFKNATNVWSDGTPFDADEQQSLFSREVSMKKRKTFYVEKNSKKIQSVNGNSHRAMKSFLCSKNKPILSTTASGRRIVSGSCSAESIISRSG